MELSYVPKWEIKNKWLQKLDEERKILNSDVSLIGWVELRYGSVSVSEYHLEKIGDRLKKLEKSRLIKSNLSSLSNDFDNLILQDIKSNVSRIRSYYDYLDNPNHTGSLGVFLANAYEKPSYEFLIGLAKQEKQTAINLYQYHSLLREYSFRSIENSVIFNDEGYADLKKDIKKNLLGKKEIFDGFFSDLGISNLPLDYKVELLQDYCLHGAWTDYNKRLYLNPDNIFVKDIGNGSYTMNQSLVMNTWIHELTHKIHESICHNTMPPGLAPVEEECTSLIHLVGFEGMSVFMEQFSVPWIKRKRSKLNLNENDLEFLEKGVLSYIFDMSPSIASDLLELAEIERANKPQYIKSREELVKKTGIKRYGHDYYRFGYRSIEETLFDISYVFGKINTQILYDKIRKKLKPKKMSEKGAILQAMMTGVWSNEKARESFIFNFFLPRAVKDGRLK